MTPVLRTTRGYQIIKIEALQDTTTKPFEEARERDRRQDRQRASARASTVKFIARLRAEAIIDWKNDEIKKAYEVGLKHGSEPSRRQPLDGSQAGSRSGRARVMKSSFATS